MSVCAVSFKECWTDGSQWLTDGGFALQMGVVASIFGEMDLLVTKVEARSGGIPLPAAAKVIPIRRPWGHDTIRKLSVVALLPYYVSVMSRYVRKSAVVHVPLPGDLPFLAMWLAVATGKPLIARYGSSWPATSQTTMMNRVTKASMRLLAGGRNVMLVTGVDDVDLPRGLRGIFSTALSSGELEQIRPDLNRGLSDPPKFIYAGRLAGEKGVSVLIEAFALLDGRPILVIAGDGAERASLVRIAHSRGCAGRIRFMGQLNRGELSKELGECDICIHPSLTESFSKAWLDAFAHGLPVITSNVGAAAAAIGSDGTRGWLAQPGDPKRLATVINGVLDAPVCWPALRQRCREYAEAHTLDQWRDRIANVCAEQWG